METAVRPTAINTTETLAVSFLGVIVLPPLKCTFQVATADELLRPEGQDNDETRALLYYTEGERAQGFRRRWAAIYMRAEAGALLQS